MKLLFLKNYLPILLILCSLNEKSIAQDSTYSSKKWYKTTAFRISVAPSLLIAYGLSVKDDRGFYSSHDSYRDIQLNFPDFHSGLDNFTQFVPAVSVYGLHMIGIKGKNELLPATVNYCTSMLFSTVIVTGLKHTVLEERPDASNNYSFPSGHTTSAFVAAEYLHQEYGHKSVWYSIAGYTIASMTGTMRMLNNKHWQSDVLVGAGIGMFSTKLIYFVASKIRQKKVQKHLNE